MDSLVAFAVLVVVGVFGVAGAAVVAWMCLRGLLLLVLAFGPSRANEVRGHSASA